MNNKGMVLYGFLLLFLLINFAASAIIVDFFLIIQEEKLYLEKERSRLMVENVFEEGLALIHQGFGEGYYFINEGSHLTITSLAENYYLLECQSQDKKGFSKAEGRIKTDDEAGLIIGEKKIY